MRALLCQLWLPLSASCLPHLSCLAHDEKPQDPADSKAPAPDEVYQNPVDKKSYVAPGGWNTYRPSGGVEPTAEKVSLEGVRLLQSQEEIGNRTSVRELATFIDLAHRAASEVFASYDTPAVLLVQFTCLPEKCPPDIAFQGEPPQELLRAYYDRLKQLKPLRVSGEVKFQFTLRVRP